MSVLSDTPIAQRNQSLSRGAKLGISLSIRFFAITFACVIIFNTYCLRKKRRETAIRYPQQEIDKGRREEMNDRVVLESEVEVVFEEDGEDEGRNEMSLQRRQ